jgi:hypothetical protein
VSRIESTPSTPTSHCDCGQFCTDFFLAFAAVYLVRLIMPDGQMADGRWQMATD